MMMRSKRIQPGGRRVAIIGAGPAGLVSAKTMKEAGFDVTVYEIGSVVGGTWVFDNDNGRNFIYRNLHINTSKKLTAFKDFPFGVDVQRIPDHRDMADYLQRYAVRYGLMPLMRFRSEVVRIAPGEPSAGKRWNLETANGAASAFDIVIVCTGPYTKPLHDPGIRDNFTGEYLHSAEYRVPEALAGKRVCIIGAANSAVDVASDICTTAKSVTLVARSPVFIMPHILNGREMYGVSEEVNVSGMPMVLANGNNVEVDENLARRTLMVGLDAGMERPELRNFNLRPAEMLLADRGAYIAAILTAARAFLLAHRRGDAQSIRPSTGSFNDWSDFSRSMLVWYGFRDPIEAMAIAQAEDPEKAARASAFKSLSELFAQGAFTVGKILERIQAAEHDVLEERPSETAICQSLRDNLRGLLPKGERSLTPQALGTLFRGWSTKVEAGLKLHRLERNAANVTTYAIRPC